MKDVNFTVYCTMRNFESEKQLYCLEISNISDRSQRGFTNEVSLTKKELKELRKTIKEFFK